jgi:thiamine biosynthesis lipoprotein
VTRPGIGEAAAVQADGGSTGVGDPFRFTAIGTEWQIDTESPLSEDLRRRVRSVAEDFDRVWSRFRADSLITRIAHAPGGGRFEFPARDVALFELYDRLVAATDGAVDPLVGRDLELLGYDARYSLVPDDAAIAQRRRRDTWARDIRRDATTITTDRPVVVDVGAAGKGYLVDLIADALRAAGTDRFLVDGSGDLRHRGPDPVTVGLAHPTLSGRVIGRVPLRDAALCASATNRRTWGEGLHHVLDGRTRLPVTAVVATWVIAADAATADGLATALFVSEPERLRSFVFRWVRMLADGRVQWSNDFDGELFI